MDSLLKQLRVRFAGVDEDDEYKAEKRQRKTGSSISERKKKQTWFSTQMSQSDYSSDGEHTMAIAAVAYAIKRLEEEEEEQAAETVDFKNSVNESGELRKKTKNKMAESFSKPTDSKKMLRWFSGKEYKPDGLQSGDDSLKNPSTSEKKTREEITWERKISVEKLPEKMPSAKSIKAAIFADKYPRKMDSRKYDNEKDNKGGSNSTLPYTPFTAKQRRPNVPLPSTPVASNRNYQMASGKFSTEADAWAKEKLEKIRKKYEKMNTTILEWESEKKMKAKRRLENRERELEERRARARQEYRNELIRIDKISGGARALAVERKRNDEAKTIEKANKIRTTGRLPTACSCF